MNYPNVHVRICTYIHIHVRKDTNVWCFYMYIVLVVLNKVPCPVYCSGCGKHCIGIDVMDESH